MSGTHQALLMAGGAMAAGAYWNPADKHADVVLSSGNKHAANTALLGALRGVRGAVGKTSGVHYVEFATDAGYESGDMTEVYVGVATAGVALAGQPIFGSLGGQYAAVRGNTQYGSEAGYGGTTAGTGWASGDGVRVVGLKVDVPNRQASIYDYGGLRSVMTWGDTAGAPVFPWVQMADLSATGITLRVLAGEFTLGLPGGATEWGTA